MNGLRVATLNNPKDFFDSLGGLFPFCGNGPLFYVCDSGQTAIGEGRREKDEKCHSGDESNVGQKLFIMLY